MASALENARLFDETKRLLAEADERAGELTVINEIGEALARHLEFDAIIQLVGERVRTLFAAQSMFIAIHDPDTNLISVAVRHRRGRGLPSGSVAARARDDLDGDHDGAATPGRDARPSRRLPVRSRSAGS